MEERGFVPYTKTPISISGGIHVLLTLASYPRSGLPESHLNGQDPCMEELSSQEQQKPQLLSPCL